MFPISLKALSDKEKHDYILQNYVLRKQQNSEAKKHKRDIDVIKEHHRFLWNNDEDIEDCDSWEHRLARRYYDKLFKEYCIADLTRYKENKIAMRWRTEAEVVAGVGQFQCGSRKCQHKEELKSWEVNFVYFEQGVRKNALVKLRLCPLHSTYLNYTSKKREFKRLKRNEKKHTRKCRIATTQPNEFKESSISEEDVAEDKITSSEILPHLNKDKNKEPSPLSGKDYSDNVWSNNLEVGLEMNTREQDFQQYLEDLLI